MDLDEDYTPRYLLRGILDTEPNRSPVARSTSAEAQRSPRSTRQSAKLRSDAGGAQSSSSSTRQSARLRSDAGAPTPQEALRRSLKRKLRESSARVSLPVGNRRTTSTVTRKSSRISALQDDVTPRHILKNILQTEPEVSLLFQEKDVGKEPVPPRPTSSMGSSRPSTRLSDLEFSSVTLAAADQSERRLKRKRSPRILDVTAFEKRLNQGDEAKVSLEEVARKEPVMPAASSSISPSSASGLSELDLSTVSTDQSVRGLRRKRPPRILNVTAFEKRLNQEIDDRPERESSSASSASTTLSGVTLSLKTPHMDARTEKKALQRKAPHHRQFTVEAFEEGLDKMLSVDGATGGVSLAACSEDFTLNLSDAGPECTTDLFNHATALYAQPSVMGTPFPITATQDKCTVLASQIQRDAGDEAEEEMSQDEQMEVECSKLMRKQSASYPPAKGEEEVPVESQPEEEDAAAPSQSDEAESQTEDEAVGAQSEEEKPVESHTGEEAESQPEEEEAKSQPEEEAESQPEEEAESQPEEEEAESQPEEDSAVSQMDEEAHESQTHEVAPESLEEESPEESQTDDEEPEAPEPQTDDEEPEAPEPQTDDEEPEAPEFQTDDESQPEEAESQPEEDAAVSQTHEDAHESQLEEAPEVEPESQTDEEEPESQPEDQMEEEAVPESQSEEEDNGKPDATIEGTPRKLSHVAEKISHRAFRSEGGGHVPVAVDGGRDYRSMGAVPKATEAEWTGNASADEGPSERHSGPPLTGHVSGTSAQIAEDPADQEEWEDEDNDEAADLSMKTPAFIRAIRKGVVTNPQSSPVLKNIQPSAEDAASVKPKKSTGKLKNIKPSAEDAASVKPKKRTGKTAGQKKKEPPSIFTKSYCMGNFKHFAKTKVSPDVYPVLKETMEKFFDRMVEDLETYANHAKRKTIEVEDVILLLKRQGHVTDKVPVEVLIERYLDMSARKQLIPCASSGNVVFPKSLP